MFSKILRLTTWQTVSSHTVYCLTEFGTVKLSFFLLKQRPIEKAVFTLNIKLMTTYISHYVNTRHLTSGLFNDASYYNSFSRLFFLFIIIFWLNGMIKEGTAMFGL